MHVHRNCGTDSIVPETVITAMMETNDLSVISLLADMGNAEVKPSREDLAKVNGRHSPLSKPGRIVQWDAEWHWDATYEQFGHQALGGHLVLLGLNQASQMWEESPWRILDWAKKQNAVRGFAHFQYLSDNIPSQLNCCIPIDYPVEAALSNIDFISEDVYSSTMPDAGGFNAEAAMYAYYKLLNCGFKIGLAAGTDYPCNGNEPLGALLTYVKVDGELTYNKWINGIRDGKTVVSRNGHREFLDLVLGGNKGPGDELAVDSATTVNVEVKWTATEDLAGQVDIVHNGKAIKSEWVEVKRGEEVVIKTLVRFDNSGWICARRINKGEHQLHTASVFVSVAQKPIRASRSDALFFVAWIDNLLEKTKPGQAWARYFNKDRKIIRNRYKSARDIYQKIARESTIN